MQVHSQETVALVRITVAMLEFLEFVDTKREEQQNYSRIQLLWFTIFTRIANSVVANAGGNTGNQSAGTLWHCFNKNKAKHPRDTKSGFVLPLDWTQLCCSLSHKQNNFQNLCSWGKQKSVVSVVVENEWIDGGRWWWSTLGLVKSLGDRLGCASNRP